MNTDLNNLHLLFRLIAEGDEAAFSQLMEKHWNLLYSQSLAYLKDRHKAQDLVQEVFLVLWKNRQKLVDVESPEDYLFIIARNKIFNEVRKKIALPLQDNIEEYIEEQPLHPHQQMDVAELDSLLQSAIQKLPPQCRRVFELSRKQGLTYEAIAGELGISRETVKAHMVKALSYLRQFVRPHIPCIILLKYFFPD